MNLLNLIAGYPIFFCIVILTILLIHNIRRSDRILKRKNEQYFARERVADCTQRKPLDSVDYIVVPYDELPLDLAKDDPVVNDCINQVIELKGQSVANFTGLTNTDLKLEYGAPNFTHLSRCDSNFTLLVRAMDNWADRLYELGYADEALSLLTLCIKWNSDISSTYMLAAKIYSDNNDNVGIAWVKRQALAIPSMLRDSVIKNLDSLYPEL